MKPELIIIAPLPGFLAAWLNERFTCHDYANASDKSAVFAACKDRVTGLVMGGGTVVTPEFLDGLPALNCISVFGVGYDGVPIAYVKNRGLKVGHTPDVLSDEVADLAMALMLMSARQLPASERFVNDGKWLAGQYPLTTSVHHKRVGIVGLGRIGKILAKRCAGFDMVISYHNRNKTDVPYTYFASLTEMAAHVDFLVAITPGGAGTQKLINAEVLTALGKKGILINVARGSVVDEEALISALDAGSIAGAGLDVFAKEPQVPAGLLGRANVVVTPHVASATTETRHAMGQRVVDNLLGFYASGRVVSLIPELQ